MHKLLTPAIVILLLMQIGATSLFAQTENVTRQETLRGSITPEREWWDLLHYHLKVEFLLETRRLKGSNEITFKTLKPGSKMQIDLQPPFEVTKLMQGDDQRK